MMPMIKAIRSSVSSIDRCIIPIYPTCFCSLQVCRFIPYAKLAKIDIFGNKKHVTLEKVSNADLSYISLDEPFSASSLISLFKNTESTVLTTTTPPKIASSSKVGSTTVFRMSDAIRNSSPSKR